MTAEYRLLLGSNHSERRLILKRCVDYLSRIVEITGKSEAVVTPTDGDSPTHTYLNMVIDAHSDMTLEELEAATKGVERELGRTSGSKSRGIVEIDIDIMARDGQDLRPKESAAPYYRACLPSLRPINPASED